MNIAPLIRIWPILFLLHGTLAQAVAVPVASVALSVGDVKRLSGQGTAAPLALGALIAEGDHIITGDNAPAPMVPV